jgi:hypothetical protein
LNCPNTETNTTRNVSSRYGCPRMQPKFQML